MRAFVLVVAFFAFPALAQEGPSFDCARAQSSAEKLVCADAELAGLDRRLGKTFSAAVSVAGGLDAGRDEAVGRLKAMQRGWIKGRDECWKASDERACVETAYLTREAELVATWMLEDPVAEAAWTCGGNPANAAFVMYFDTALPAVRVEYGDGIEAMWLTPTASGTRYDGTFGRYFWEHQGEATFAWEQGTEQTCERTAG